MSEEVKDKANLKNKQYLLNEKNYLQQEMEAMKKKIQTLNVSLAKEKILEIIDIFDRLYDEYGIEQEFVVRVDADGKTDLRRLAEDLYAAKLYRVEK